MTDNLIQDEIHILPRWAQVALAVRSVRRVLPLIPTLWHGEPQIDDVTIVAEALQLAESASRQARLDVHWEDLLERLNRMVESSQHCIPLHQLITAGKLAMMAAVLADHDQEVGVSASATLLYVSLALGDLPYHDEVVLAMNQDFRRLSDHATLLQWSDTDAVPDSVFETYWPFGLPKDWPTSESAISKQPETMELATISEGKRNNIDDESTSATEALSISPWCSLTIHECDSALGRIGQLLTGIDRGADLWDEIRQQERWIKFVSQLLPKDFVLAHNLSPLKTRDDFTLCWHQLRIQCESVREKLDVLARPSAVMLDRQDYESYVQQAVGILSEGLNTQPASCHTTIINWLKTFPESTER